MRKRARDVDAPPPEGSILHRVYLARWLNRLHACTTFHAWNVGALPAVDIEDLQYVTLWGEQLKDIENGR